jgi:phytoene dehydrogenase-like protein
MKYDVAVIGAGLGGLTAGAKLAREGKKVILIEQHTQPGGCATTFKRGDFTLEVGLHEMDGLGPRDMKARIFSELGVTDNVELIRVPEFYHFIGKNLALTIPHVATEAAEVLKQAFPSEVSGIDAYFEQLLNPKKKAADGGPIVDISVGEFLDSIISNEDLKLVLLGNLGYFHDDPYSLSLAYYTIAQGSYYSGGASFIKGGSQVLSDHLVDFIRNNGGDVVLGHIVNGFVIENGVITGVSYRKVRGSSTETFSVEADEIIANAALPNIAEFLPEDYRSKLKDSIKKQSPGASLLTIYFGFKSNLEVIGNKHYSTFVFDDSIATQADIIANNKGPFSSRSFTFIDYGRIDSGLATQGKSVGAICCIDYLADWESLSSEAYKNKKEEVAQIFIDRLEKILPGIRAHIQYYEVGTPVSVKRYTLNPGGAVYGFAQTPAKPSIEVTAIPDNVHIASAWGKTGGGFSGAIYSGYLCAYNLLRKRK